MKHNTTDPKSTSRFSRNTKCGSLLFIIVIALGGCMGTSESEKGPYFVTNGRKVNIEKFDMEVTRMMDDMGVPGMSFAIIENDEIVLNRGYGRRIKSTGKDAFAVTNMSQAESVIGMDFDLPLDTGTVFNGASLSKTYSALVAMQMVDEGKLDLDKPLFEYMEYNRVAHDDRYKQITARMVLSHSSGLENWQYQNDGNVLEILATPGEKYVYSGEGYVYLALVTKKILGEPYTKYVQERIIDPLGLKNSFLTFNDIEDITAVEESVPANFAAGHPMSGGEYLLRNKRPHPAYANHFSAADYARTVMAFFDPAYVSLQRRKNILDPRVRIDNSNVFYGPGFEMVATETDTIISHGGDMPGIKNLMFYSPVHKRGFVMLTNNDYGRSMAIRLNELSTGMELKEFFTPEHNLTTSIQYPNPALPILKTYGEQGVEAMFVALEKRNVESQLSSKEMNALALMFMYFDDWEICKRLLDKTLALYPNSPTSHSILGDYYKGFNEYETALGHYEKSRALNFKLWDLQDNIDYCNQQLSKAE